MRVMMRITPDIHAAAREYVENEANGCLSYDHVGHLFPIRPQRILWIWEIHWPTVPKDEVVAGLLVLKDGRILPDCNSTWSKVK